MSSEIVCLIKKYIFGYKNLGSFCTTKPTHIFCKKNTFPILQNTRQQIM